MTVVALAIQPWSGWPKGATVDVAPDVAQKLAAYTERAWTQEDLEVVGYIGPIRERALVEAGIVSLEQLANPTPEMLEKARTAGAGISDRWMDNWRVAAKKELTKRKKYHAINAQQLHSDN